MKQHQVLVHVEAPDAMAYADVVRLIDTMLNVGYADAAETLDGLQEPNEDAEAVCQLNISVAKNLPEES